MLVVSVHELPFHDSTLAVVGSPPKARPAVDVPAPAVSSFASFKSPTSVQELPL